MLVITHSTDDPVRANGAILTNLPSLTFEMEEREMSTF
jgi:hypothetical protein